MKENIKSLAHLLFEGHGLKTRWIALCLLLLAITAGLLVFDHLTSWSYYRELNQQTAILERLNNLANDGIQKDTLLVDSYEGIAYQITLNPARPLVDKLFPGGANNQYAKFISASLLGFMLLLISLITPQKNRWKAVLGSVMVIVFLGTIGVLIPTILHPTVNYTVFPIVQILVILIVFRARIRQTSQRAKMMACRANMRTISSQIVIHCAQHKSYPKTSEAALQEIPFLAKIVCPECKQNYLFSFSDTDYAIRCPNEPPHGSIESGQASWQK